MKDTIARIIIGIMVLAFGTGAFLDAFNVIEFWPIAGEWWPAAIIVAGLLVFFTDMRQFIWGIALVLIGGFLLLDRQGVVDVNIWEAIWPTVIIAVGLSILVNKSGSSKRTKTQDTESINAILSGTETANNSKDYKGGNINAILGGVELDLRDAVIKKEATLNVSAIMGGIEIKVPDNWQVRSSVFPILGGVEIKNRSTGDDKGPILHIVGTVTLAGVEIRR